MEVRRNNSRAVLGELKLSNSANVEPSSRRTVKTTESHISPDSFKNAEPDGFISSVPKSTTHLSNLELLTKVASRVTSNNASCFNSENAANSFQPKESVDINCKPRKEKSLSILCDKFLKLYPLNVSPGKFMEISLDQATQFIGTDRRRIYDILIVLECLQMASKVCKNHYQWHGTQHLTGTLSQLKWLALRLNFLQNVNSVLMEKSSGLYDDCSSEVENADLNVMDPSTISAHAQNVMTGHNTLTPSSMSVFTSAIGSSSNQKPEDEADFDLKDSSFGIMCQKFLMLFLVTSKVITLDNAAKILLGDTEGVSKDCHKVKTKIRRLYDIANVLSSLELIKKVNISGNAVTFGSFIRLSKKPAFQYIGPDVQPKPLPNDDGTPNIIPENEQDMIFGRERRKYSRRLWYINCTRRHRCHCYSRQLRQYFCCACDSGPCFPGESKVVLMPSGDLIPINRLRIGQYVQAANEEGQLISSKVLGFLDKRPNETAPYITLTLASGHAVSLSANHLLYVTALNNSTDGDAEGSISSIPSHPVYAGQVQLGHYLYIPMDGQLRANPVVGISYGFKLGAYVPLTEHGSIIVDGALASCYASFPHWLSHALLMPARYFPEILLDTEDSQDSPGLRTFPSILKMVGQTLAKIKVVNNYKSNDIIRLYAFDKHFPSPSL